MVDADLTDGSLGDVVTALTTAFRSSTNARVIERTALKAPAGSMNGAQHESPLDETAETEEAEPLVEESIQVMPPAKPRKLPLPDYLHDLDTVGEGPSLKDFVAQHQTKPHLRRYLVASYWLRHHGKHESVNADKVYTVYRTVGWQTNINDWDVNFRNLVKVNKLRRVSPGEYMITPIGDADVEEGAAEKT
jgi:hypothetical protein